MTASRSQLQAEGIWPALSLTSADSVGVPSQQTQFRENIYAAPFDALAYNGMQINGSCDVDQVNAGASVAGVNGYAIDGWQVTKGGTMVLSSQQVTDAPPGLSNSLKVSVTTAEASIASGDYSLVYLPIEGYRVARLAFGTSSAQPVTLGFWVKANRTGTYSGALKNGSNNLTYTFNFTISASLTWQFITVTVPGCTTGTWGTGNGIGLIVYFVLASGSTYTISPNAWTSGNYLGATGTINGVAATSDTFQVTGLIILPGIEMPSASRAPLIMRPYGQELQSCRRYWQASFASNETATTFSAISGNETAFTATDVNDAFGKALFVPEMRSIPTVTFYSSVNRTAGKARAVSSGSDIFITISSAATKGIMQITGSSVFTAGQLYTAAWVADARL